MDKIKELMLQNENHLSKYACFDKDAIRLDEASFIEDIRPNYFRDTDRIIHSMSYTRYMDKTQVFSKKKNDNISKRMMHVQLVSKIARTIGRALSLNEDLIEAGALGHDIGHVPFGHLGEAYLDELSMKHGEGHFQHNVQSVRNLMVLENDGKGLNLTVQTLDAILCHNGEFVEKNYKPKKKTKKDFLNDYENCYKDNKYNKNLVPMTLEGCVVRISDIVGYLGRDIEDAVRLGVFDKKELPKSIRDILGDSNKSIINTIIMDIINNSLGKNYISMSDNIYKAIKDLKDFNYKHIYSISMTEAERYYVKLMFNELFEYYLDTLKNENRKSNIYKVFLSDMSEEYKNNTSNERIVIDYISGMTDQYFLDQYKQLKTKKK